MEQIFGFAILSFFITAILLVPFIDFLYKMKLQRKMQVTLDVFNKRAKQFDKMHALKAGVPMGGGLLIIFVVTLLTLWAYGLFQVEVRFWELFVLLFSFIGFGALGFYDDIRKIFTLAEKKSKFFGLRFKHKFALQWLIALIIGLVFYSELGYSFVYFHWIGEIPLGILFVPFAAFVIVSFVNAVNITDGLDGLASGLFLICLIAFLTISSGLLDTFLGIFIAILMGAIAAFLYFNVWPARIILGDVGSLALGGVLAVIGLLTGKIGALGVIGGVFVIEVTSSFIQLSGKKFLKKRLLPIAPIHLYFQKKGWEEPKVVMRAWLLGFLFAVLGLYIAFVG